MPAGPGEQTCTRSKAPSARLWTAAGRLGTPKSRLGRVVPLIDEAAGTLARLGARAYWTGPDDLVFVGEAGGHVDGSALRRRFANARGAEGLRPLRFHDLRHTFGSVAIRTVDPRELQEWLGHSDFATTQIYMNYRPRADAARRLSAAFDPGAAETDAAGLPSSLETQ